jgi:multidrug transporter EmrE-like cation transporter
MGNQVLLACGMAAGPVFTVAYLLEGVRRVDYKPFRHPVSSLSLGRDGWAQTVNFIVAGLLSLMFAVGLWRVGPSHWGALLIGTWAVGLLGAGVFRTDPVSGYPPGTPDQLQRHTHAGALHDMLSLIGFLALTVACFVFALSNSPGWVIYSITSGVLFAAIMALSSAAFSQHQRWVRLGGLIQRVAITIGWTWQTLLAVRILHA